MHRLEEDSDVRYWRKASAAVCVGVVALVITGLAMVGIQAPRENTRLSINCVQEDGGTVFDDSGVVQQLCAGHGQRGANREARSAEGGHAMIPPPPPDVAARTEPLVEQF
jgi:hypothetical protein